MLTITSIVPNIIILLGLFFGSITDIKRHEVLDLVNYSLITLGFLLGTTFSLLNHTWHYFFNMLAGLFSGLIIGFILYFSGQWGGGDAKMIIGIGALMGVNVSTMFSELSLFYVFFINSLLVGAVYGLFWVLILVLRNAKNFVKEFSEIKKKYVFQRKIVFVVSLAILLIIIISSNIMFTLTGSLIIFLLIIGFYSNIFLKAAEKSCMIKNLKVSELVEGDWVVDEFTFKGKKFVVGNTGLTLNDIDLLKKNNIRRVRVKQGVPFVPSFLIAFIITLVFGNWFLFF